MVNEMKLGVLSKRQIVKNTLIVLLCIATGWFVKSKLTPPMPMAASMNGTPHVLTTLVGEQDISIYKEYIGNVEAIKAVNLIPQISGYLEKVMFDGGSRVREGTPLFVIERERYDAEYKKAKATFVRLEREYKRQESLRKQGYASEAQLDTAYSDFLTAQANMTLARINLDYSEIKAPFTGYIGKAFVTEGNLVSSAGQTLARIVQTDPIRVAFSMSDRDFLELREELQATRENKLRIKLILPNGEVIENQLLSHFVNNEVNPNTATVSIFAIFENANNSLIPGNFVQVLVDTDSERRNLIIPQQAVSQDKDGLFVYVVGEEDIVEQRRVKLGKSFEGNQIVLEGLQKGEQIVVQGLQSISDGKKVKAELVR